MLQKIEAIRSIITMAVVPIISGLVQDISIVIWEQCAGKEKYLLSMVSREWNLFCKDRTLPIKLYQDVVDTVDECDILRILKGLLMPNVVRELFGLSCYNGNMELINILIKKGADNWDVGLHGACMGNHIYVVNYLIKMGSTDWNYGLEGACRGGNISMMNRMIARGARDWNSGLYEACLGGHHEAVVMMISKGAHDFGGKAFENACLGGNVYIVRLLMSMGSCNLNWGIQSACYSFHFIYMYIMNLLWSSGPQQIHNIHINKMKRMVVIWT